RDESVEFSALAAGVGRRRQIGQQRPVEFAAGETGVELSSIDTNQSCREAIAYELAGEIRGVASPDRENRIEAAAGEQTLPIGADVFQKEIAECDVLYFGLVFSDSLQREVERRLVRVVGAVLVEENFLKRQAEAFGLGVQQRSTYAMDADAIVAARDTGEKSNDLEFRTLRQRGESEGAVLPAAPAKKNRLPVRHASASLRPWLPRARFRSRAASGTA